MTTVSKVGKKFLNFIGFRFLDCCRAPMSTNSPQVSSPPADESFKKIKEFIPKLTADLHKGQCGRIGIIGGSEEYTGAPYFAAISALKTGADLVYVFCCRQAAPVIKSYSPELIVHPILDDVDVVNKVDPWLSRLHALVIGPGLGREPGLLCNVGKIITHCKTNTQALPLIIDADGLHLITENPDLIKDYNGPVILTPNPVELGRLKTKLSAKDSNSIASELNAVLVQKGLDDVIINGIHNKLLNTNLEDVTLVCNTVGSNRRCGGQGDILAGCIATFVAWFELHTKKKSDLSFTRVEVQNNYLATLSMFNSRFMGYSLAAYGACTITKHCSRLAFEEHGRSMTASDMIPFINKVFQLYFGD